jgi:hypothetical protein
MRPETTRSSLRIPNLKIGLVVCAVILILGMFLLPFNLLAGLIPLIMGGTGTAAALYWSYCAPEFEHAAPGTWPEIPEGPVLEQGSVSFSWIPYEIVRKEDVVLMKTAKDPARIAMLVFLIPTMTILFSLTVYFLWFSQRAAALPLNFRIEMTFALAAAGVTLPWLFPFLRLRMLRRLEPMVIDRQERRLRFEDLDLSLEQVKALQLCASYRKLRLSHFRAVELNLVWTEDSDGGEATERLRRTTLFSVQGVDPRLGPFAETLADALDVPLLNHVTNEHWKLEMQAARHRPCEEHGQAI